MKEVSLKMTVDKKGSLDVLIDGFPEDIITGLVMTMIDNPEIHELFNVACKAYESYKQENLSN